MTQETDMPERELLAEYAHKAWSGWMAYMFDRAIEVGDGCLEIQKPDVDRWNRQLNTPYADLPESEKKSDRAEADKILALLPASRESALKERLEKEIRDNAQHRDTLRGILQMARDKSPDIKRIDLWCRDGLSGYTEPLEATVLKLSDERNTLRERLERAEKLLKSVLYQCSPAHSDYSISRGLLDAIHSFTQGE